MTSTHRYLDVSVHQIQRWLTRAPHLRGRRGASSMLTRATHPATIEECLRGLPARLHGEAGAVDGVVSVLLEPPDGADRESVAAAVQARLFDHLRDRVPAAFLVAIQYEGLSYVEARHPAVGREVHRTEYPPVCAEWAGAKRCAWCNMWPATVDIVDKAGEQQRQVDVCRDCLSRDEHAGRCTEPAWKPLAESRLSRTMANVGEGRPRPPLPETFAELAMLGPLEGQRNHLATIFADGNQIGALIEGLRHSGPRGRNLVAEDRLRSAPATINDATWAAAAAAAAAIDDGTTPTLRIVPHLVGGDDLLVSVPAHCGWEFLRSYLTAFAAGVSDLAGAGVVPSASAGMVIHQVKEPISVVVDLAHDLLVQAKREYHGAQAAIRWQSVTHDGTAAAVARRSVTLTALSQRWDALDQLVAISPSQRQVLSRMLRDDESLDSQLQRVRVGDMAVADVVATFTGPDSPVDLPEALRMVQWWWPR